jgi:uncharacterized cupredoxin-like copper-binding protein
MVDLAFQPSSITIPADTETEFEFANTGASLHDFAVDELGGVIIALEPGQEGSATITAPAGTYTFYCSVPGHREAGMEGTLTVE